MAGIIREITLIDTHTHFNKAPLFIAWLPFSISVIALSKSEQQKWLKQHPQALCYQNLTFLHGQKNYKRRANIDCYNHFVYKMLRTLTIGGVWPGKKRHRRQSDMVAI